jgi:hypothetical protein
MGPATRFVLFSDFCHSGEKPTIDDWRMEYGTLIEQGLAGLATRVIHLHSVSVPDGITRQLQDARFNDMKSTVTAVTRSQPGIECLTREHIPFVITKGPGIALQGESLSDRPYMDLDVLVDPHDFNKARDRLALLGYTENGATMPAWDVFNRSCREAINLRSPTGGSIDLHHRVSPWLWSGSIRLADVKTTARSVDVFGVRLPLISPEHNLLVAALHVVSDKSQPGQTYRVWRDLLVLEKASSSELVVQAAKRAGLCAGLAWLLGCFPAELRPHELLDQLAAEHEHVARRWRLRMLLPPRFGSRHQLGQIFRLPVPNAILFTVGMMLPSPEFLRQLYPDADHRYLTWWGSAPKKFTQESSRHAEPVPT